MQLALFKFLLSLLHCWPASGNLIESLKPRNQPSVENTACYPKNLTIPILSHKEPCQYQNSVHRNRFERLAVIFTANSLNWENIWNTLSSLKSLNPFSILPRNSRGTKKWMENWNFNYGKVYLRLRVRNLEQKALREIEGEILEVATLHLKLFHAGDPFAVG